MALPPTKLPLREIPGDYGLPFIGPMKDRFDYFYRQGEVEFFKSRMLKHNSTVFRCNMPPGPFIASKSGVICVNDAMSFQILFDNSKVEKKDVLDGTFMPTTAFTGGYRTCAYLDTSEHTHEVLKSFFISMIAKKHREVMPLFREGLSDMFSGIESEMSEKGKSYFNDQSDKMAFEFVFRLLTGKKSSEVGIGNRGPRMFDIWLLLQLGPLVNLELKFIPNFLQDLVLRTFPLPFFPSKGGYDKLYKAFNDNADAILDEAERVGLKRDEACHNLVFLAGFNAYGGMKGVFPALIKWVAAAGKDVHRRLAEEIRSTVKRHGQSTITLAAMEEMSLTKSVVYETLRMEPSVPYQYAIARDDLIIRSHEHSFKVKKGEVLFGYQPLAVKDPAIFSNPEEFVADRFVGAGEKLLEYLYWSNGRETDSPAAGNKQCPAKDLVVLLCRMIVVEFFMRYDTLEVVTGRVGLVSSVTFTSLTKKSA